MRYTMIGQRDRRVAMKTEKVDVDRMARCRYAMIGQRVLVAYVVFEVNENHQLLRQREGDRYTTESSVVHIQSRGAAHCHKLIVIDCYNTMDPLLSSMVHHCSSRCRNIWKAQGSSIGRKYWNEHYKLRIPRNLLSSFTTNMFFFLIHKMTEE